MEVKEAERIIERSINERSILATDQYVEAQTSIDWFSSVCFQMGPNCNKRCVGCYGNFGPDRKGLPNKRITKSFLEQALEIGFDEIDLTDGEPLRHENRDIVKLFSEYSNKLPVSIVTNGSFARTWNNTLEWFNFLKNNGFNLGHKNNHIQVSVGLMYGTSTGYYQRINQGIFDVFPGIDFGKHLAYSFLRIDPREDESGKPHIETMLLCEIVMGLKDTFGVRNGQEDNKKFVKFNRKQKLAEIYVDKSKSPIILFSDSISPKGRAYDLPIVVESLPEKILRIEEQNFTPETYEPLSIRYTGDVGFRGTADCIRRGHVYGNLLQTPLKKIIERISKDPIYLAQRLGGLKFIWTLAKEIEPNFQVIGRTGCDVCHTIYDSVDMINAIRGNLRGNLIGKYKEYIDKELFAK